LPQDYVELQKKISERLTAAVAKDESRRQTAEMVSKLSVVPNTKGLAAHELLALTLIFEEQYSNGVSFWSLSQDMRKAGYLKVATSLAVSELQSKRMIELKRVPTEDFNEDHFFATPDGIGWLTMNQGDLNLKIKNERNVSDSDFAKSAEISDDDIPF